MTELQVGKVEYAPDYGKKSYEPDPKPVKAPKKGSKKK